MMKQSLVLHSLFLAVIFMVFLVGADGSEGAELQCEKEVARIVSLQGKAEGKDQGTAKWNPVEVDKQFCPGDSLRILRNSRAALLLENKSIIRLDQNTIMTLGGESEKKPLLIQLIEGALYYFSIKPESLSLETPFINGAVEGTEFLTTVTDKQAEIAVFEGKVSTSDETTTITVESGEMVTAGKDQQLRSQKLFKDRKSVQWTLYYPPLLDLQRFAVANNQTDNEKTIISKAVEYYFEGDLHKSLQLLEDQDDDVTDPDFYRLRIALYLVAGRVYEAQGDIKKLYLLSDNDIYGLSFQSLISLIEGDLSQAEQFVTEARAIDPENAAALMALSYVQQAQFKLKEAKQSIEKAMGSSSQNGLLFARYAELSQSLNSTSREALEASTKAMALLPHLSQPRTLLGFAHLNRAEIDKSKKYFLDAITLNQTDPLPRLGLGLTEIYEGNTEEGRDLLTIATVLDSGNAIIRSYLGKAYFELRDYIRADIQLSIAKNLDPNDPTPFFYSAVQRLKENNPGAALLDLKQSMENNNNRAVYRSQLMLDRDLAARSSGTARVYNQLGFDQLALNYGRKSLENTPSDYSSHRLLADSYSSLPNHEIARVSELLQSQLLQPLNIGAVQPQLGESRLHILDGAGPSTSSFHEFNHLFQRNSTNLLFNGVAGGNDTLGNDLVVSGNHDTLSYSFGQFYYSSDGFRENNDIEQQIYNGFLQWSLTPTTHLIGELRSNKKENGDLKVLFDPDQYSSGYRGETDVQTWRVGGRHAFSPRSELISAITGQQYDESIELIDKYWTISIEQETKSVNAELQHIYTGEKFKTVAGGAYYDGEIEDSTEIDGFLFSSPETSSSDHTTLYGYGYLPLTTEILVSAGATYDDFDDEITVSKNRFSPKIGLSWTPTATTTLRAAWLEGLTRNIVSDQTLEPTQLAGFNQFYDNVKGTESEIYGLGFDHEFSPSLYAGASFVHQELDVPYKDYFLFSGEIEDNETAWENQSGKIYLYWLPLQSLSLSFEYLYEKFDRGDEFYGTDNFSELENHKKELKLSWFHPSGARAQLAVSHVDQQGMFVDPFTYSPEKDSDSFWMADISAGYLLPKGYGLLSLDIKNLFNTDFNFQESDPTHPTFSHEQLILIRVTFNL